MQSSVKKRYSAASKKQEAALCCPVNYDAQYLKIIPKEVIDRDYGCGDPSHYVRKGDTVLDLGSGGGKVCFIAAQIVGPTGKVIGVDGNPDMLELARTAQKEVEAEMGYQNLEFKEGFIQDLHMIADDSIDIIISNCVLNLVSDDLKDRLFSEMFRVLRKGGRIAISDIVSDEISPTHLKANDELWSGCISGALQEAEFIKKLEEVGFYGIALDKYEMQPWQIVEGIEYRSVTITAYKGKEGPYIEKNQAVIYKGPWKQVEDDDDHVFHRGVRTPVCEKTFQIMSKEPYSEYMIPISEQPTCNCEAGACKCETASSCGSNSSCC